MCTGCFVQRETQQNILKSIVVVESSPLKNALKANWSHEKLTLLWNIWINKEIYETEKMQEKEREKRKLYKYITSLTFLKKSIELFD